MKRLVLYCIIVTGLLTGLVNVALESNMYFAKTQKSTVECNAIDVDSALQLYSAQPFTVFPGERIESFIEIAIGSSRITAEKYLFRISHFANIHQQNFISSRLFYIAKCAHKRFLGYFLYFLRKLLI